MTTPIIGTGIALTLITIMVALLIFISGARITPFNPHRAATSARKFTSGNALLLLSALNLASFVYHTLGDASNVTGAPADVLAIGVSVFLITLILLIVVARNLADAAIGVTAVLVKTALHSGPAGVIALCTVAALTLVVLALARGFIRAR